jgi:phospholipid/cholesterol/gamma-HCH transport system substrate-binding protein
MSPEGPIEDADAMSPQDEGQMISEDEGQMMPEDEGQMISEDEGQMMPEHAHAPASDRPHASASANGPSGANGNGNGARANAVDISSGGRGMRDQIERYRTAFVSVVVIILVAALTGGYVLGHERLSLPSWFPVLGHKYFSLKGEFTTAQAVIPGQGQSVTIAGAKIGEIASVDLHEGRALVSMNLEPKYARYIYRDATMLLRPKTQLQDMTVEVDPGEANTGRVSSGETIPIDQTAPNIDVDEFLAALDAETRTYLQELLAGGAEGLKGNAANLAATFKRFDPIAHYGNEITHELAARHANIARAIHNFRLLVEALGGKDHALSELVDATNATLGVFAKQNQAVQTTLHELPTALRETNEGLRKFTPALVVTGSTLAKLQPFAKALAPAQEQSRPFFIKTTPIFKNEIRPFTREIEPVVSEFQPDLQDIAEAFPQLTSTLSALNEFFNELAYNPGPNQAGFLFYLDWFNHNLNSISSDTDANGPVTHTLLYFACPQLFTLTGVEEVNPTARAVISLIKPPSSTIGRCPVPTGGGATSASELAGRVFGHGLQSTFGIASGELGETPARRAAPHAQTEGGGR